MNFTLHRSIRCFAAQLPCHNFNKAPTKRQFWASVFVLSILSIGMRLYDLSTNFQHDFDEGVYWQTIRAMSYGHRLYKDIFYSQPPFFALLAFSSYQAGGQTLAAARFGVAAVSLLGIAGAALVGLSLRGRAAALVAMALTIVSPIYLRLSQSMQADIVSTALSFLAVGLAYGWLNKPEGSGAYLRAGATGLILALSILAKFLCLAACVPIGIVVLMSIWQRRETILGSPFRVLAPIGVMLTCFFLTLIIFVFPFRFAKAEFIDQVITFHQEAGRTFAFRDLFIRHEVATLLLASMSLFGTVVAIRERDWRVYPLIAWLFATIFLLTQILPLWNHHLVALVPPLVGLASLGVSESSPRESLRSAVKFGIKFSSPAAISTLLFLTIVANLRADLIDYREFAVKASSDETYIQSQVVGDVIAALSPDQRLVTDEPFIAGLAGRSTPPRLVDSSQARIRAGYLTVKELEEASSRPDVRAVLFFSGRFQRPEIAGFQDWVSQNFWLRRDYGSGRKLWVR